MAKPCEATGYQRGVYVKTWSGTNNTVVCKLGSSASIKHLVTVENLMLYPADIKCKGEITSMPRVLEFSCNNSPNTTTWKASIKGLAGGLDRTFSPCDLVPTGGSGGPEVIKAEVTINWSLPGKRRVIPLSIQVAV